LGTCLALAQKDSMHTYRQLAEDKHKGTWRGHQRVKPTIGNLKSLSWPAYVWANKYLAPWDNEKDILLDLGGGTGNFSYLFKDKVKRTIVLDFIFSPLSCIKESFTDKLQANIFKIPLKDNSVSKILFSDVMEHFKPKDIPQVLQEMYRVLNIGGTAFVNTSCYGFYLRRLFYRATGRPSKGRLDWADLKDGHFSRLTHEEMLDLFQSAGFKILEYRFLKHLFQPILQILRDFLAYYHTRNRQPGNEVIETKRDFEVNSTENFIKGMLQALVNLWSFTDLSLFGRIEGGAVYYKLLKSLNTRV
jgi:ubiquinone/menaquinone biosynthesis C-methylase UbiE